MKKYWRWSFLVSLVGLCWLLPFSGAAQLTIDNSRTPEELVREVLLGEGVEVFNITYSGDESQFGSYSVEGSNLQISKGLIMTTGGTQYANTLTNVQDFPPGGQFNNRRGISDPALFGAGDEDLRAISGVDMTADAAIIEFDFIPSDDVLEFRYVFGSEEYPNYACSDFNDVFAFLIQGPGYNRGFNIALIPGTTTPVAINSINNGVGSEGNIANCNPANVSPNNPDLYIDNIGGSWVEYDGMTVVLTARAEVQPCETYHIKIGVADAFDSSFDSGVFLEANSFSSEAFTFNVESPTDSTRIVEGCGSAEVALEIVKPAEEDLTLAYEIFGSAIEGVDFEDIPDELVIAAGDSIVRFDVTPILDDEEEGVDTIYFAFQSTSCMTFDTLVITIGDPGTMELATDQAAICNNVTSRIELDAQIVSGDGVGNYTWSPPDALSDPNSPTPTLVTDTVGIWVVEFQQGTCIQTDTFQVFADRDIALRGDTAFAKCNTLDIDLDPFESGVSEGLTYSILDGMGASFCTGCPLATFSDVPDGTYKVIGTNSFGCQDSLNVDITIEPQIEISNLRCTNVTHSSFELEWEVNVPVDEYEVILDGGLGLTVAPSGSFVFDGYTPGDGQMIDVALLGRPDSEAICPSSVSANVTCQLLACTPYDLQIPQDTISCNEAPITLTSNLEFDQYVWSAGAQQGTSADFTISQSGLVTLQAEDEFGCSARVEQEFYIVDSILTQITKNDISCDGLGDGIINLSVSGGQPNYDMVWNNAETTPNLTDLQAGTYTVMIEDALGCMSRDSIEIKEPDALTMLIDLTDPQGFVNRIIEGCSDSEITVDIGDAQISEVELLFRTSGSALMGTDYTDIPTSLTVVPGDTTISFRVAPIKDGLVEGLEQIIIEARRSTCDVWDTLRMEVNDEGFMELVQDELEICLGDALTFQAEAIIPRGETTGTFLWSPAVGLSATDIANPTVQVTGQPIAYNVRFEQDQCIQNGRFEVTANHELELVPDQSVMKCDVLDLDFDPYEDGDSLGIRYDVIDQSGAVLCDDCPNVVLASDMASAVRIVARNGFGCLDTTNVQIDIEPQIVLSNLACTNATHSSFDITLDANTPYDRIGVRVDGGTEMFFDDGVPISLSGFPTGDGQSFDLDVVAYPVDGALCLPTMTSEITCQLLACTDYDIGFNEDLTSCDEQVITVTTTRPFESYSWSLGTQREVTTVEFEAVESGNLSVDVLDEFGCADSHSEAVNIVDSVRISAEVRNLGCSGDIDGEVRLSVSGGNSSAYQYLWGNGATTANIVNLTKGDYSVTITDDVGCSNTGSFEVKAPQAIGADLLLEDPTCNGYDDGQVQVVPTGGSGIFEYILNNGGVANSSTLQGLSAQEYQLSIVDDQACRLDTTFVLGEPPLLSILNETYLELTYGETYPIELLVTNAQGDLNYQWSGANANIFSCRDCGDPDITAFVSGNYLVTVIDDANCKAEHLFQISVSTDRSFVVPTGFTPNGDLTNDRLNLHGVQGLEVTSFDVYSRDGALIYTRSDFVIDNAADDGWDGTFKGQALLSGTYVWHAEVLFPDGVKKKYQGYTELIR